MKRNPIAKRKLKPEQGKMIVEVFTNKTQDKVGLNLKIAG